MLLAASFLIAFEVLARKFAGISTGGADELSSYAFAISTSWGLSFAVLRRAHVRVDALYAQLNLSLRALLDILALAALSVFAATLAYHVLNVLRETITLSATANTTLGTPLWIPQSLWVLGFVLFSATLFLLLVKCIVALARGDFAAIQQTAGSRSVDDEIADEIGDGA